MNSRAQPTDARRYHFVVCGAGSSGSVVARRLSDDPRVRVMLVEAGGSDDDPAVHTPQLWPTNVGSERDWAFRGEPDPGLDGRSILFSMGKVLGGGSSINVMVWARGHQTDWDAMASVARDAFWGYESVLDIYRKRIEDWHGVPDVERRGSGGPAYVAPPQNPHPLPIAIVDAAAECGLSTFDSPNGKMMESPAGAALSDLRVRDGKRESVFRSYVGPVAERPNLTVVTRADVLAVTFDGNSRATGVRILRDGRPQTVEATEVILSLGAINTPKVLMQSGVGDARMLRTHGIPIVQHLPGVGTNFHDHVGFSCIWESAEHVPVNPMSEATLYWPSEAGLDAPDLFACSLAIPLTTPQTEVLYGPTRAGWTLFGGLAQPTSRGRVTLTGPDPHDPVRIEANMLSEPEDMRAAVECIRFLRHVGDAACLRPYVKHEVMPRALGRVELERYVRNAASTYWHEVGTARMGYDEMSVVGADLRVHGIEGLRIADGSILPRITTGNTMAPCVVIGERAAELIATEHGLQRRGQR